MDICECVKDKEVPAVERGDYHHKECPKYSTQKIPRLFYWEEGVDAWCPWVEDYDFSAILDLIDEDEIYEMRFKRLMLTDAEMDELEEI